jgi:transcriptional regulator with XRE-family HTH domain
MAKRAKQVSIEHAAVVRRFGERLRQLRTQAGFTQEQLAEKAQVTSSYVGRLERGGAAPGIDLVERLAKALGVKVADLLPEEEDPQTMDVLREQARALFDQIIKRADRETLTLLNPLMARLVEDLPAGE